MKIPILSTEAGKIGSNSQSSGHPRSTEIGFSEFLKLPDSSFSSPEPRNSFQKHRLPSRKLDPRDLREQALNVVKIDLCLR